MTPREQFINMLAENTKRLAAMLEQIKGMSAEDQKIYLPRWQEMARANGKMIEAQGDEIFINSDERAAVTSKP